MLKGKKSFLLLLTLPLLLVVFAAPAFAQEEAKIDTGDTAWLLMSCALVMMMTAPGLALFYGGLVGHRNVLSTLMHSFFLLCLISVQWVVIGYSIAFGSDIGGFMGGMNYFLMNGVGVEPNGTIPHIVFAMFQMMFAIITVALISGTYAERISFKAFVLFSLLWATIVYDPLCHWVWGKGGWLLNLGALDFAGGTVVHISSGAAALVSCLIIGKRDGYPQSINPPHNVPFTLIGGALLWFGWFGFNAGSALGANGTAGMAFAATNTACATAGLTWALVEWLYRDKPTILGAVTGAVAGLVAITPAAGFVSIPSSLAIGIGAGVICFWGCSWLKNTIGYDDALDVVGVHGLGGTWGALATGLFAQEAYGGANGLFFGDAAQFGKQIISVLAGWGWAALGTAVILFLVKAITPLRVSKEEEIIGLDLSLHGEVAYHYDSSSTTRALGMKE